MSKPNLVITMHIAILLLWVNYILILNFRHSSMHERACFALCFLMVFLLNTYLVSSFISILALSRFHPTHTKDKFDLSSSSNMTLVYHHGLVQSDLSLASQHWLPCIHNHKIIVMFWHIQVHQLVSHIRSSNLHPQTTKESEILWVMIINYIHNIRVLELYIFV